MNRLVEIWDRHQSRPKYDGRDSVMVDDEEIILPSTEERTMAKPASVPKKVGINRDAVSGLALYGPQDLVESLYDAVHHTLERLGTNFKRIKNVQVAKGTMGPPPCIHGILLWLDALDNSRLYKDDVGYLKKLFKTTESRVRPDVLKK